MEFRIRQHSTEPFLKLRLIDDGKNDKSIINERLENAIITFDMYKLDGEPVILNSECELVTAKRKVNNTNDEIFILYRFKEEDTKNIGKFEGKITIQFLDYQQTPTTKLIVPISEKLFINII